MGFAIGGYSLHCSKVGGAGDFIGSLERGQWDEMDRKTRTYKDRKGEEMFSNQGGGTGEMAASGSVAAAVCHPPIPILSCHLPSSSFLLPSPPLLSPSLFPPPTSPPPSPPFPLSPLWTTKPIYPSPTLSTNIGNFPSNNQETDGKAPPD